jgi:hypothetical protein
MLQRIDAARFPGELTAADKKALAIAAITYGFDPIMNEISIYQGRPYISIDGRYRKAQETGKLDGVETRPANKQERIDWEIPDGDYFFRSEVYVKGIPRPFVGWGRIYEAETHGKGFKPVEKNPQRMAEKRAEAQALRKAFHIPLPSYEDIGTEELTETVSHYDIETEGRIVDKGTGEIIDAEDFWPDNIEKPVKETPAEPLQDAAGDKNSGVKAQQTVVIPNGMKTLTDMQKIIFKDIGMQPVDQLKELGYSRWADVTETPAECYTRLMAAYYERKEG